MCCSCIIPSSIQTQEPDYPQKTLNRLTQNPQLKEKLEDWRG